MRCLSCYLGFLFSSPLAGQYSGTNSTFKIIAQSQSAKLHELFDIHCYYYSRRNQYFLHFSTSPPQFDEGVESSSPNAFHKVRHPTGHHHHSHVHSSSYRSRQSLAASDTSLHPAVHFLLLQPSDFITSPFLPSLAAHLISASSLRNLPPTQTHGLHSIHLISRIHN